MRFPDWERNLGQPGAERTRRRRDARSAATPEPREYGTQTVYSLIIVISHR